MKIKVLAVGLGLVLLCALVLVFEAAPPDPEPSAVRITASGAASQRSARALAPSLTRRPAPDPAEPVTGPPDQALPGPPPLVSPPLTPDQENARLRKILDESGPAAGDALDRSSHDIANDLVARLRAHDAQVNLQAVECRAAGCTATLAIAAQADYFRLHDVFDGLDPRSPFARWPGSRIMPPVVHRDGKLLVAILLIRPDARAQF